MTTTIIDLFAGIGGFHIAAHNLGIETVFASEWDKYARKTYETNLKTLSPKLFADNNYVGDITKISPDLIPDFDILCAGFPCQPFSVSGLKAGFEDTRGTLFFNIAEIIKHKQPKAFFLENVRGLKTHNEGKTFKTIQNVLTQLGYSFHWKIIKASEYNLPQHRPRTFMVGFHSSITDTFNWPEKQPLTNTLNKILKGKVTTLTGKERHIGFTLRVGGRQSGITDKRNWDSYLVDGKEHLLTIDEAKRLQGFPDWFTFEQVSTTQAFKQLGNSVAIPAVQAVMKNINQTINKN